MIWKRIGIILILVGIVTLTIHWSYVILIVLGFAFMGLELVPKEDELQDNEWQDHNGQTRCKRCAEIIEDE